MKKIGAIRDRDVKFTCGDFNTVIPIASSVYLDPPYEGRKPQDTRTAKDVGSRVLDYAVSLAATNTVVLITEFRDLGIGTVVHDFGDTVVRHQNSKGPDGTRELLVRL
jgi:hypothetical protein